MKAAALAAAAVWAALVVAACGQAPEPSGGQPDLAAMLAASMAPGSPAASLMSGSVAGPPRSSDGHQVGQPGTGLLNPIPLLPYVKANNLRLPDTFLLLEQTIRFISPQAVPVTPRFRAALEEVWAQFAGDDTGANRLNENTTFISLAPSLPAPVIFANGTRVGNALPPAFSPVAAPAPHAAGGLAPAPTGGRFDAYASADLVYQTTAAPNSTIMEVLQPSLLASYVAVAMLRAGYQVQALPLKLTYGPVAAPLIRLLPLRPIYVIETILNVDVLEPIERYSVGAENVILSVTNAVLGSQQSMAWNVVRAVWLDPELRMLRPVLRTYVTQNLTSLSSLLGNVGALLQQKATDAGFAVNLTLGQSMQIGTLNDELFGELPDLSPVPTAAELHSFRGTQQQRAAAGGGGGGSSGGSGLSSGAIAGIVVGGAALLALAALAAALQLRSRKRRQRNPFASQRAGVDCLQALRRRGAPPPDAERGDGPGEKGFSAQPLPLPGGHGIAKSITPLALSSPEQSPNNSGSSGSVTHSGHDSCQELAGLAGAWSIRPRDISICRDAAGNEVVLGTGSFGRVLKGVRDGVAEVAIKRLVQPDSLHLKLFQREISIMRALNYDRSIVQFYGACLQGDNLMLVQELMEGGDLRDALGADDAGALRWHAGGATLLLDVARGLNFLHANKCVHRDLKTKNILLTAGARQAKIADVGLAKLMGSQIMSSCVDATGTFAYAAPELLLGHACDTSADIYSFAVVAWEVVTHEVPIRGNLRPIRVPEECPQALVDLIVQCLDSPAPARPSARQVFERLRSIREPPPPPAAARSA